MKSNKRNDILLVTILASVLLVTDQVIKILRYICLINEFFRSCFNVKCLIVYHNAFVFQLIFNSKNVL